MFKGEKKLLEKLQKWGESLWKKNKKEKKNIDVKVRAADFLFSAKHFICVLESLIVI